MSPRLRAVPIQEAGRDLQACIAAVQESPQPTVITQAGQPAAVLLSTDLYTKLVHELEVLRRLALGELESTIGFGFSLEQVTEECDLLLEEN